MPTPHSDCRPRVPLQRNTTSQQRACKSKKVKGKERVREKHTVFATERAKGFSNIAWMDFPILDAQGCGQCDKRNQGSDGDDEALGTVLEQDDA